MITPDLLKRVPLLAGIDLHELEYVAARAADIVLRAGDWLIQEGEQPAFFIVLSGAIDVLKQVGGHERKLTTYAPGDFAGEVPLLLGAPAIASLRASVPSRVAKLAAHDFRELFASCRELNAEILRTMTTRVGRLQELAASAPLETVALIGHRYDLACHALRDFLARNRVPFRFRDYRDPDDRTGEPFHPQIGELYPLIEFPDGSRLATPTLRELADKLGLQTAPRATTRYDVAIVGAGPAGLAAAVYGASEGLSTILIEREAPGGQAGTSSRIENYLGFPTGIAGDDLGNRALQQAQRFGAEIVVARGVEGLDVDGTGGHAVVLDGGERVAARAVILATGVAWRQLDAPGADRFVGRGLYYGASRAEAPATRGRDIYLIGGGNSAGQAAMHFAGYARTVTLLVRGDSLARTMSHYLIRQLESQANVHVQTRAQIVGLDGDDLLASIEIEDRRTGARRRAAADGVFAFIGADAKTSWLPPRVVRDELGYICTGRDVMDLVARDDASWRLPRDPYLLETSVPGVFAAGDVRHGSIKRVAAGVGEGSMAIAFVHPFLAEDAVARPPPSPAR